MRIPASIRMVLLATLLAASHVAYAVHVTAHHQTNVSNCEWCVCQAQSMAGPLPVYALVTADPPAGPLLLLAVIPPRTEAVSRSYQSRAPPVIV